MKHQLYQSKTEAISKVPAGKKIKITVDGRPICLVNIDNTFHAVSNSCPHLGESLSNGTLNYLGEIVCPWHSYRFNLKSGEEAMRRCKDLKIYRVTEEDSGELNIEVS